MTDKKEIKIEFAPGCFDHFDGTQEELDQLIADITRMAETGEILENAREIEIEDLSDEEMDIIAKVFEQEIEPAKRKLQ
jgi:hypothetical protein